MTRMAVDSVQLSYGDKVICENLDLDIEDGSFTVIVGPNACGKSTLLKSISRLISPQTGQILLDGKDVRSYPTKQVARAVGLLPQSPSAPEGVRVVDLINRGRYPHQSLFSPWRIEDEQAVIRAMEFTGVRELSGRYVDELSGGQRQRVWMAVALAQETDFLLLDEPTTYLDVKHQIEVLELCRRLNLQEGTTLVAVLHDLNQAARYADTIVCMKQGEIIDVGPPAEVISQELVEHVFDVRAQVITDPESGTPLMIPYWEHSEV